MTIICDNDSDKTVIAFALLSYFVKRYYKCENSLGFSKERMQYSNHDKKGPLHAAYLQGVLLHM